MQIQIQNKSNIQFNEIAGENVGYRIIREIDIGALFLREKSLEKINYNFNDIRNLIVLFFKKDNAQINIIRSHQRRQGQIK